MLLAELQNIDGMKIAEATYTVIIEQVKRNRSQWLSTRDFQGFEYATPPLSPSSPNRTLYLLLGTFIGLIMVEPGSNHRCQEICIIQHSSSK